MDISQAKFIDVDGIDTRYFDKGAGETIVLFHGGNFGSHHGADCAVDWNLNFDGLAAECRVIAIDKIGQAAVAASAYIVRLEADLNSDADHVGGLDGPAELFGEFAGYAERLAREGDLP